jgi:hypothetical protein
MIVKMFVCIRKYHYDFELALINTILLSWENVFIHRQVIFFYLVQYFPQSGFMCTSNPMVRSYNKYFSFIISREYQIYINCKVGKWWNISIHRVEGSLSLRVQFNYVTNICSVCSARSTELWQPAVAACITLLMCIILWHVDPLLSNSCVKRQQYNSHC